MNMCTADVNSLSTWKWMMATLTHAGCDPDENHVPHNESFIQMSTTASHAEVCMKDWKPNPPFPHSQHKGTETQTGRYNNPPYMQISFKKSIL